MTLPLLRHARTYTLGASGRQLMDALVGARSTAVAFSIQTPVLVLGGNGVLVALATGLPVSPDWLKLDPSSAGALPGLIELLAGASMMWTLGSLFAGSLARDQRSFDRAATLLLSVSLLLIGAWIARDLVRTVSLFEATEAVVAIALIALVPVRVAGRRQPGRERLGPSDETPRSRSARLDSAARVLARRLAALPPGRSRRLIRFRAIALPTEPVAPVPSAPSHRP